MVQSICASFFFHTEASIKTRKKTTKIAQTKNKMSSSATTTTSAQLADYVEQLFSSLSPHVSDDFDPSKEFISFDDESEKNGKKQETKPSSRFKLNINGMTLQQLDLERLRLLQYGMQILQTRPSDFYFDAEKKSTKLPDGWRVVSTLQHFCESNLKKAQQQDSSNSNLTLSLAGVSCQILSKILIANFAVQNSKEFTSLCRKCVRLCGNFVRFFNQQKSPSNAAVFNVALLEILAPMGQQGINLVQEDVQLIENGALYGLVSLKNNSEANMMLSGSIYALMSMFDREPVIKYKHTVKTLIATLNDMVDECFKFVRPENDPRQSILEHFATGTAVLSSKKENAEAVAAASAINGASLIQSLRKRKNPISGVQFMRLFKSISTCLQRCLTIPYPFMIELNVKRLMTMLKNSFVLDSSLKVDHSMAVKKIITLQSYYEVIPCMHRESLKILSAVILSAKGALLPYVNNIAVILFQEFNLWSSVDERPLESLEVYREVIRCICFAVDAYGPCISDSLTQKLLTPIQKMMMQFYSEKMRVEMDRDINKDTALQQLKQHYNVTNKKNKKRRRNESEDSSDDASLSITLKHQYLTLKLLRSILSSCQVHASLETMSTMVDVISTLTTSISLFHSHRFVIFQNVSSQTLNKLFTCVVNEQYRALHQSLVSCSAINTQSPFLPLAVTLFRKGVSSGIPEISKVCNDSLQVMESFLHPRSAPLHVPSAESVSVHMSRLIEREKSVAAMLTTHNTHFESSNNDSDSEEEAPIVRKQTKKQQMKPIVAAVVEKKEATKAPIIQTKEKVKSVVSVTSAIVSHKETEEDDSEEEEEEVTQTTTIVDFSKANHKDIEKAFEKTVDSDEEDENMSDVDLNESDDDDDLSGNIDLGDLQLDFSGL